MDYKIDKSHIDELRKSLAHGEGIGKERLDEIAAELEPAKRELRPDDKTETLPLFDRQGQELDTLAPRWICHLLALRHRCAHILLLWRSPSLGDSLVLQIRDWEKDDSPGHLDISVGGHMTTGRSDSAQNTAFAEMLEETGLRPEDLEGPLESVGGYSFDESRPNENFHNSEWRDVYIGRVRKDRFGKIRFPDGEVAAVVVVPLGETRRLLAQEIVPMASALTESLPKCLESMEASG